jgi:hypothetical protein
MSWFGWKLLHPMPSAAGSIVAVSALLVAGGLVAFVGNFQDRSRGAALTQKCKDAGAKFLRKPSMPVRSVAHDWDAAWTYGPEHPVYELDHQGHISGVRGIGVASPGGLDFEERRYSPRQGQFSPSSRPQFVRMYRDRKLNPIDALSADVLILHEVSDLYEKQGPVRHTLTVHDRRSGDILATMTYWIDRKNGLGCGANKGSAIDEGAFIQQAILQ